MFTKIYAYLHVKVWDSESAMEIVIFLGYTAILPQSWLSAAVEQLANKCPAITSSLELLLGTLKSG